MKKEILFNCEFCGKEHDGSYGSGRFCSSVCKNGYISKLMSGKGNPRWMPRIKKYICKNCGIKHDGTYGGTKNFCSRGCSYKYRGKLLSERQRGKNNPNYGGLSKEHKRKIGLANLGKTTGQIPWNRGLTKEDDERIKKQSQDLTGRKLSKKTRKKISINKKEYYKMHEHSFKGGCHTKESRERMSRGTIESIKNGISRPWLNPKRRPTSIEKEMIRIIEKEKLPFNYVGDGKFWITSNGIHMNPDFVSKDRSKKIVIEVFSSYFKKLYNDGVQNYKKERKELLNDIGWKGLFFEGKKGKLMKSDEKVIELISNNL